MASLAFDFVLLVETADFGKQGRIGSPARNELGHGRGVGRCNIFAHARRQPARQGERHGQNQRQSQTPDQAG